MKKNIKILSVLVLFLFVGSYAAPLFTVENCDMPESTTSAMHCDMNMSDLNCCETITQCVTVPLLPISAAPINKVELQKDLTIDFIVSQIEILTPLEAFTTIQINEEFSCRDVHPGFQTPLLV